MNAIYLDMDGTIADLYAVPNWLKMLRAENPTPYIQAEPLVRLSALARHLNRLQRNGYIIGIISWGSKHATPEYVTTTREKALEWLEDYIRSEKYEERDTEKVIAEINKHDYVENVFDNRFYAIDEVLYED